MCHHQVEDFLGHALEQGEAVVLDMTNDRLGDGAVVERLLDVVVAHRLDRRVEDIQVDQHILTVEDLVLIDADVGAQAQILHPDACHSRLQTRHHWPLPISWRNSIRVLQELRKAPSITEVFITEFCFSTPRIIMHMCLASITTATPAAPVTS